MNRMLVAICLLLIIYFSSCEHFERDRDYRLYYAILATNDTLDMMTRNWHQMFGKALIDKNFGALTPQRLKMGQFLSRSRNKVGALEAKGIGAQIVDSEMVFLANRAVIVSDLYTKFEGFNELTPRDQMLAQAQVVSDDLQKEAAFNAVMKRALSIFAAKNKLKLNHNKY